MFSTVLGALLGALAVGVAVGTPIIGMQLDHRAQRARDHEAHRRHQRELLADYEVAIAAYRALAREHDDRRTVHA